MREQEESTNLVERLSEHYGAGKPLLEEGKNIAAQTDVAGWIAKENQWRDELIEMLPRAYKDTFFYSHRRALKIYSGLSEEHRLGLDYLDYRLDKLFDLIEQYQKDLPPPSPPAQENEMSPVLAPLKHPAELSVTEVTATKPKRKARKSRGKKPGDGSYARLDLPYIKKMKKLMDNNKASSANDAARQIVEEYGDKIKGSRPEQKQDRLGRRYRDQVRD